MHFLRRGLRAATGEDFVAEIESHRTARRRDQHEVHPDRGETNEKPHPLAKNARRAGHPRFVDSESMGQARQNVHSWEQM
jgi:hypothetical protein